MTGVSVLCPTYNRSRALEATLESVLAQDHTELELLVGSDGSTDDTDDVVREVAARDRRVRLVRLPHRGDPGLVRASLAREARHDVLAYVDHDDLWGAAHLSAALAHLTGPDGSDGPDGPDDAVVLDATYTQPDGTTSVGGAPAWHREIGLLDPFAEPTRVVHTRRALERAGGWRCGRHGLEDWDLWWRMAAAGTRFRPVPQRTCVVACAPTSRRWSVGARAVVVLARSSDRAAASAAERDWSRDAHEPLAALVDDVARWSAALAHDGAVVQEATSTRAVGDLASSWLARPRAVEGGRDGWLVALVAPIVSPVHRQQVRALVEHRFAPYLSSSRAWLTRRPGLLPVKETHR